MNKTVQDMLMHYGVSKLDGAIYGSGRYPLGSGDNPYQHGGDFYSRVNQLRSEGFTYTDANGKTYTGDVAIAKSMGMTTTELRTEYTISKNERRAIEVNTAKSLRDQGYSLNEIAAKMGYTSDSSVRSLLNASSEARMHKAQATADYLKKQIDEKGIIDVGAGVERELGISKEKLNEAIYLLKREGYEEYGGRVPQATNAGMQTTLRVLCPPRD